MVKTALTAIALLGTTVGVAAVVAGAFLTYVAMRTLREADE